MSETSVDILLVGSGIMSATLATLLQQVAPALNILMVERLEGVALESSDGWNNAGTGHAGYCELNYTPQKPDGSVDIQRALGINAAFEVSLQLWASLVEQQTLTSPREFINATPHISFVWGDADVAFLKERHARLSEHHLFFDMAYSEDIHQLNAWMPLVMKQRAAKEPMAATHVSYGSDIDFGTLTRQLIAGLQQNNNFTLLTRHQVETLRQARNGRWQVSIKDIKAAQTRKIDAGFVFLGAGGGALPLLQKSGISESKGYGGFPVSGQWLVCQNEAIIKQHNAKVYGKAPIGAPPMSVPHLDTRIIHGRPALLFGPYAGFTTKFLKQGSFLDLVASVKTNNLRSMLSAGLHNRDLTRYLVGEVLQSHTERMRALRHFYPEAKEHDWVLADAGQRVQIIKNGKLEFGTEIVTAADGTLAALLGASPGASTSVPAMLQVLGKCFPQQIATKSWADRLMELIPSYGQSLIEDAQLLKKVRSKTLKVLKLN